jgi:hypothetical protein
MKNRTKAAGRCGQAAQGGTAQKQAGQTALPLPFIYGNL